MISKRSQRERLLTLGMSILLMTFGSMTSPLFPLHTGVDQNCFLSVAKFWLDGRIPYRDIYEQKGPLLYLLHLPAAAMPTLRFFGVYLLQIVLWYAILCTAASLSDRFLPHRYAGSVQAISGLVMVCSFCYSRGDNAEELCLLPVMCSLCDLMDASRIPHGQAPISWQCILKNGVFAGLVLWIKFSMLGFYIGWCILIGIWCWREQGFLSALRAGCCFLGGMLLTTLPWLLYFGAHHALGDLIEVYFISNATRYPRKITLLQRILDFFAKDIGWNPILMPLLLSTVITLRKHVNLREKTAIWLPMASLYCFVFIGGVRYRYYLLILAAFVPVAISLILPYLRKISNILQHKKTLAGIWCTILLLCSNCTAYFGKSSASYPQMYFAQYIPEGAVLLNYGFLDGGFALISNAQFPAGRFFCKLNIYRDALPEMYEAQEETIRTRAADFVVVRWETETETMTEKYDFSPLYTYYEEIAQANEPHDGYSYALFQRRSDSKST